MRRYLISALLMTVISACGQAEARPESESEPTATVQVPAKPTVLGTDKTGGAAIIYQRSGGIAGIAEMWTIYSDGRIVSGDGQESSVTPEEVSALLTEIEALGFFDLRESGGLLSTCRDCFIHQITVSSSERFNSIRVEAGGSEPEDQRLEIVEKIYEFVSGLSNY